MSTLEYILNKYKLRNKNHIEIPDVGRDDLAKILHELDFKVGAEVGVRTGLYSELLCKENPQMKLYAVDLWMSYKTHDTSEIHMYIEDLVPQKRSDQYYEEAKTRLSSYSNVEIIKETSMDAIKQFEDESLDFVYIDADHKYEYVIEDITEWSKKIKKGGIVSGHDYYKATDKTSYMHVKFAVDDYVIKNNIRPLIIWGSNYMPSDIVLKRDKRRSWSWVK